MIAIVLHLYIGAFALLISAILAILGILRVGILRVRIVLRVIV